MFHVSFKPCSWNHNTCGWFSLMSQQLTGQKPARICVLHFTLNLNIQHRGFAKNMNKKRPQELMRILKKAPDLAADWLVWNERPAGSLITYEMSHPLTEHSYSFCGQVIYIPTSEAPSICNWCHQLIAQHCYSSEMLICTGRYTFHIKYTLLQHIQ